MRLGPLAAVAAVIGALAVPASSSAANITSATFARGAAGANSLILTAAYTGVLNTLVFSLNTDATMSDFSPPGCSPMNMGHVASCDFPTDPGSPVRISFTTSTPVPDNSGGTILVNGDSPQPITGPPPSGVFNKFVLFADNVKASRGKAALPVSCDEITACFFALEVFAGEQPKLGFASAAKSTVLGKGSATIPAHTAGVVPVKLTKAALKRLKKKKKLKASVTGTETAGAVVRGVTGSVTLKLKKKR